MVLYSLIDQGLYFFSLIDEATHILPKYVQAVTHILEYLEFYFSIQYCGYKSFGISSYPANTRR